MTRAFGRREIHLVRRQRYLYPDFGAGRVWAEFIGCPDSDGGRWWVREPDRAWWFSSRVEAEVAADALKVIFPNVGIDVISLFGATRSGEMLGKTKQKPKRKAKNAN